MKFGRRVCFLRKERGWSQEVFADLVGVNKATICHIERRHGHPSLWTIERIAIALGITLEELFQGVDTAALG